MSYLEVLHGRTAAFVDDDLAFAGRTEEPLNLKGFEEYLMGDYRKTIGVDFALYGDDSTVIAARWGPHVVDVQKYSKMDPVDVVNKIIAAIDEHEPDQVILDGTGGLGAIVADMLMKAGIGEQVEIVVVLFNERPRDQSTMALNQRAEMYIGVQKRFRTGRITLPQDKDLIEELAYTRYEMSQDKLKIVRKEEIKKLLGRSPDKADAVCLAFYDLPALEIF